MGIVRTKKKKILKKKLVKKRKKKIMNDLLIENPIDSDTEIAVKPKQNNENLIEDLIFDIKSATPKSSSSSSRKTKMKTADGHYIDNKKMCEEMTKYRDEVEKFQIDKDPLKKKPKVPEYIGSCILMIAERLATKPNFFGYSYKEEMISDGIENCLMYIDNFNPKKSSNPFAYFTQIIYYAFLRRIQKEKKQSYIKMRLFERQDTNGYLRKQAREIGSHDTHTGDTSLTNAADYFKLSESDVGFFDKKAKGNKKNKKKKFVASPDLTEFFNKKEVDNG